MIKPNYSSRGRNIVLIDNINDIKAHDNGMKIVQKYIENIWILHEKNDEKFKRFPFLNKIYKRKFDIRIWVLVKSFSPLTVYIFEEGYLRISSSNYQLNSVSEKSHMSHLTNYSVNWKSKSTEQQESYLLLTHFLEFL